jgi:hypothetical protein
VQGSLWSLLGRMNALIHVQHAKTTSNTVQVGRPAESAVRTVAACSFTASATAVFVSLHMHCNNTAIQNALEYNGIRRLL